eukprot:TRINITY_DN57344_c0_g1_i1.p1 TRINITY_DN57344_c0_g1~~TRINITY_DN57344_c0_g1_i1.p1  ORF type:complete len:257 (-),score=58.92 TRINITY_DN57344_c0_g1_i1:356-1126(-)
MKWARLKRTRCGELRGEVQVGSRVGVAKPLDMSECGGSYPEMTWPGFGSAESAEREEAAATLLATLEAESQARRLTEEREAKEARDCAQHEVEELEKRRTMTKAAADARIAAMLDADEKPDISSIGTPDIQAEIPSGDPTELTAKQRRLERAALRREREEVEEEKRRAQRERRQQARRDAERRDAQCIDDQSENNVGDNPDVLLYERGIESLLKETPEQRRHERELSRQQREEEEQEKRRQFRERRKQNRVVVLEE